MSWVFDLEKPKACHGMGKMEGMCVPEHETEWAGEPWRLTVRHDVNNAAKLERVWTFDIWPIPLVDVVRTAETLASMDQEGASERWCISPIANFQCPYVHSRSGRPTAA